MEPHYFQVGRSAWLWAVEVPFLPDIADDLDQVAGADLLTGYHALAEAIATRPAGSCALQIRLTGSKAEKGSGSTRNLLLGRGASLGDAQDLTQLTRATLPPELGLRPVTDAQKLTELLSIHHPETAKLVEVRRRIEDVSSLPGAALDRTPAQPAILRWAPDPYGLRQAASLLAREQARTSILLHLEPARPSRRVMDYLDEAIRDIVADTDAATNPLRLQIAGEYRQRLRNLARAALQVRVLIVSTADVSPALTATVGMALTAEGGYAPTYPRDGHQHFAWSEIFETLTAPPEPGTAIEELSGLADTAEAARVVRFPLPAYGGSIGLHSTPLPALPRAAEPAPPMGEPRVDLGVAIGGGQVALTLRELNQHVLVAGLPGFGKTVTTQTILSQLWRRHRVPFLVLDPAKSEYHNLSGELGDDLVSIELGPDQLAFNPFGVPERCSRASHAGRVLAAFDAAFQLSSVWPGGYVTLARAIYRAYDVEAVPTLDSLRNHMAVLIDEAGFSGPDGSNIRAALLGRMEFLTRGPLGVALSAPPSGCVDYAALTAAPAVVGLRGFSGPMERALVFGLLLSGLISYRESNPAKGQLGHVTVLEEAHRLLSVGSQGAETEGVRLFVEAIAELRGSGEGFIVVDQAPTLLHPGILKLAGSYCSHRLVDRQERLTVGSGLLLSERQAEDLARLGAGQVVLHSSLRTTSVVADIEPPAGILTEQPAPQPRTALPWRTPTEYSSDLQARFDEIVSQAGSPAEAFVGAAIELQQAATSPQAFRRDLQIVAGLIEAEHERRRKGRSI